MRYAFISAISVVVLSLMMPVYSAQAEELQPSDIAELSKELKEIKQNYDKKVAALEARIKQLETSKTTIPVKNTTEVSALAARVKDLEAAQSNVSQGAVTSVAPPSNPNAFNPAIGVVLNGQFAKFSQKDSHISGFAVGDEGERGDKGLSLGESEISASANIDDKFAGNLVTSFDNAGGVEVEEAFIQTLGLSYGINVKAGRALASIGYLNEKHAHTDDFADRPLPYRAFLNSAYNDDGVQISMVLPTNFYSEVGAGIWRGDDFPASEAQGSKPGAYTTYVRVGDDISTNQTWRLGASYLHAKADGDGRITGDAGTEQTFKGNDNIYIVDAKYTWAPNGNATQQELTLQGEYFWRNENGTYADAGLAIPDTAYDEEQKGWYGQAVYKFLPDWRAGYRYTQLLPSDAPAAFAGSVLDAQGHDPYINSVMVDWTHSEFSRIRLQYNNDHSDPDTDNQIFLQYIMSFGAHGAHKY
jgi:hypothetical protein